MEHVPLRQAKYLFSETDPRILKPALAEVAFVGRSNSGKSSIINALCQQSKLARVSQTPGRTRMINVFGVTEKLWLVDLPGYGFATGPASSREGWEMMIEGYLTSRPSLRCIFMLVDAKVGPTRLDLQMAEWLKSQQLLYRVLANKTDQVKSSQEQAQQALIARTMNKPIEEISWISAAKGTGIPALRQQVAQLLRVTT